MYDSCLSRHELRRTYTLMSKQTLMQTHMQGLCPQLGVNAGEQLRASVECSNLTTTPVTKERWKDSVRAIKAAFADNFQMHFVHHK